MLHSLNCSKMKCFFDVNAKHNSSFPTLFLSSSLSYAFPGVVAVTSLQCWTQRVWIGGLLESPAVSAPVLLLPVLLVSVPVLSAGFRSLGLSHRVLAGDPSSTHASSLWSAKPVGRCQCEWITVSVIVIIRYHGRSVLRCCVCCREIQAAGDQLFSKTTRCWSFTTMTPGRSSTCSREAWGSQVVHIHNTIHLTLPYMLLCNIKEMTKLISQQPK